MISFRRSFIGTFKVISLLFLLWSCDSPQTETVNGDSSLDFSFKKILIDVPYSSTASLIYPLIWKVQENEILAGYNFQTHSIDLYNLSEKKFVTQLKLLTEGPNFISTVIGFFLWSEDVFLIANDEYITLLGFDRVVLDRLEINSLESDFTGFDFSKGRVSVNKYSGLQFDSKSGNVLMEAYQFGQNVSRNNGYFVVELNVKTKIISIVELPYQSDMLSDNGGYGDLSGFLYLRSKNNLILNRKYSSKVFLWQNETLAVRNVPSRNTANEVPPFSSKTNGGVTNRIRYGLASAKFFPLIFDPIDELYFRIVRTQSEDINADSNFFLSIMDKNFLGIHELEFPKGFYIFPFVSKEGLFFFSYNQHDDHLELLNLVWK